MLSNNQVTLQQYAVVRCRQPGVSGTGVGIMSRAVVWRGRAGLDGGQGGGRLARRATHVWPPAWRVAPVTGWFSLALI